MPWFSYALLATSVTPLGTATGDIVSYILGYGVLGIGAVLLVLRIIVPGKSVNEAVERGRADLVTENTRLIAEKTQAEKQRDEALKIATDQVVPLLVQFNASVSALLPILQGIVRTQEEEAHHRER